MALDEDYKDLEAHLQDLFDELADEDESQAELKDLLS